MSPFGADEELAEKERIDTLEAELAANQLHTEATGAQKKATATAGVKDIGI